MAPPPNDRVARYLTVLSLPKRLGILVWAFYGLFGVGLRLDLSVGPAIRVADLIVYLYLLAAAEDASLAAGSRPGDLKLSLYLLVFDYGFGDRTLSVGKFTLRFTVVNCF